MPSLIHLAIGPTGLVHAHFAHTTDAAEYCKAHDLTHVPYNTTNVDRCPPPPVGTVYKASLWWDANSPNIPTHYPITPCDGQDT